MLDFCLEGVMFVADIARHYSCLPFRTDTNKNKTAPGRHQTCHFRKRATSAPAEGPANGLDFARNCESPLRALRAQKWHVCGNRMFGAA